MRSERTSDGKLRVVLSRRNIAALLAKLDGYPPGSALTLAGDHCDPPFDVVAEEDDVHYGNRVVPAGPLHPLTLLRMGVSETEGGEV